MDKAESKAFSMKLLVNTTTNKVLFAEATKDLVDFLFGLLALPLGTVAHLLRSNGMVGSLGSLHNSLENLPASYVQPGLDKNHLLIPKSQVNHSLLPVRQETNRKCYYRCDYSNSHGYVTDVSGQECPSCHHKMTCTMSYVAGKDGDGAAATGGGYVQERIVYMITDDLAVSPMSMISSIAMFNKLEVKNVCELEERTVEMGMDEALKLLKASLHSTSVLTDLFLVKKTEADASAP